MNAIIFDIDGTLLDSVDLHAKAWQDAFRKYGREIAFEDVRRQIGKGGDQLKPVFLSEDELKRFGDELEAYRVERFKKAYLSKARPFPKVPELLKRVRDAGLRVALASSAKEDELKEYKRILGIEDLVDENTSSDDADRSKPHPDIFEAVLDKLKPITAREALVVGDTPYDAEAARKAGLRTVGVTCGGWTGPELRAAGCVAVYRDPADLLATFEEWVR